MAEKVPTWSARWTEATEIGDYDTYRQHQTVGCTRTHDGRETDLVEASADSDFRRDQVSEEACTSMRRFDRAAQVRDKASRTGQLVRGLLKKAVNFDNPASARLHILVAD